MRVSERTWHIIFHLPPDSSLCALRFAPCNSRLPFNFTSPLCPSGFCPCFVHSRAAGAPTLILGPAAHFYVTRTNTASEGRLARLDEFSVHHRRNHPPLGLRQTTGSGARFWRPRRLTLSRLYQDSPAHSHDLSAPSYHCYLTFIYSQESTNVINLVDGSLLEPFP